MILMVSPAFSQKIGKVDPEQIKIDSLTKANQAIAVQLDSFSNDKAHFCGFYSLIKEKVIKYNFDPAKVEFLIDSLQSSSDTTLFGIIKKFKRFFGSVNGRKQITNGCNGKPENYICRQYPLVKELKQQRSYMMLK
jgi:hypothetical protein